MGFKLIATDSSQAVLQTQFSCMTNRNVVSTSFKIFVPKKSMNPEGWVKYF